MSDWLLELQNFVGNYPPWVVLGVGGLGIVVLLILLGKFMRLAAYLVLAGLIVGAGWLAWQHLFG